jgi:phospholipid/cholesterol/gamma-HCH transport system permease protein
MLTKADDDASVDAHSEQAAQVAVSEEGDTLVCAFTGAWTTRTVADIDAEMREVEGRSGVKTMRLDLGEIGALDTAGAWLIKRLAQRQANAGADVDFANTSENHAILLDAVDEIAKQEEPKRKRFRLDPLRPFEIVGRGTASLGNDFLAAMHILGSTIRGAQMKLGRGHAINPAAIASQIDKMGVGAIPVVVLMAAIVGAIIAQQGAFQLRYFGAEIFVVDLVGILVMRELGVLLTAIMIAGRSGSAITAEIGSMKMREEIDALKVIGLNPIGVLVFPRLVALVIALPCLTIIANFAAIGGAMFAAWAYSGIAPEAFLDRMAIIIGIIGSVEGMKVGGSAESLGQKVTTSVVKSIFIVIVVDGLFAMFYAAIDF